jgi:plasmid stabilization system protein ParE
MPKYQIIFAKRVEQMVLRHTEFLARISVPAAKAFYKEFEDTLGRMKENPYQFPPEDDMNLPDGQYRKAPFAKRYKAIFTVEQETIYLDAVVDCRMDNKNNF